MIPFGPWHPDDPNASGRIEGAIPQTGGYGPFPQLMTASGAESLAAAPAGIATIQKADDSWTVAAGTSTAIYSLASDYSWDTIEDSRTALVSGDDVSFARFGSKLINTDLNNGMKAFDIEAGGSNDAISGAPSARFVFTTNNTLVALQDTDEPRRLESSDIGQYDTWSGGAADGKTFEDGGALVCGCDLKNRLAVVFQQAAIRSLSFGAGPATYQIDTIAAGRGCVHARTMVQFNGRVYWWDTDGPWMFSASDGLVPIGAEKINRWAVENIGRENYALMQGAYDPWRALVLWRIDNSRLLAFNWLVNEFSILPMSTGALTRIATPELTIGNLTDPIGSYNVPIGSFGGGGSAPEIGGLDLNLKYATFAGSNMAATLETPIVGQGLSQLIGRVRPNDDANGGTVAVGVTARRDVGLTWKAGAAKAASGRVALRGRGNFMAFRRSIPAGTDWSFANGVDENAGSR